jgi:hypothetical protein
MTILLRALGVGALSAAALLIPALLALLPADLLRAALAAGAVAALAALVAQVLVQMQPLSRLDAGPQAFQRALARALPEIGALCQGQPAFDATWRWDAQGLSPLARNDYGAASSGTPPSAHARLAEAHALHRALAPATALLPAVQRAAGGPLVLKIGWDPGRTYLGQNRPAALQVGVGPETFPWRDRRWGGHHNLTVSTDDPPS